MQNGNYNYCTLPISEGGCHSDNSIRCPRANKQKENGECHFGDSHFHASLFLLVGLQGLDIHLFRLKEKANKECERFNRQSLL